MNPPLFRVLLLGFRIFAIFLLLWVDFSSAKKQSRIIGGKPAVPGDWPFMASIFAPENATAPAEHLCGGVIWNEDTILTAAHCLTDDDGKLKPTKFYSVIIGQTDISSPAPENTFQAAELLSYPHWNTTSLQNDVGLIKLARAIDFTGAHSHVACICDPLPVSSLGSACVTIGWGMTSTSDDAISPQLMQVELPLLPQDVCAAKFRLPSYNSSANVCTGYLGVGGKDMCGGDSGGPLLCPLSSQPSKYSLVGLTSFGFIECASKEHPSFFANVATYLQWIGQASGD